ncbi:MAG: hypothetical protein ABWX94_02095 [Candidatus Saccharimonadales bacterium]
MKNPLSLEQSTPTAAMPEWQVAQQERLTLQRDKAIMAGDRLGAAKLQGELLGLKPIEFPKDSPRVWNSGNVKGYLNPYHEFDGRQADYLKSEREDLATTRAPSPGKFFLELAGVEADNTNLGADEALDAYTAARLANEVGTYHVGGGGASLRTPDGHLLSFRIPADTEKAGRMISSLEEAGYVPGELPPVVITNNPDQNAAAFAAVK